MADIVDGKTRSKMMSGIRSKDTRPEKQVRSLLHSMGYRFRIHVSSLPGTPDIVLPRYNSVIFVHGCFWHQHGGCIDSHLPKSRQEYWVKKLEGNIKRFKLVQGQLRKMGWKVIIVWECELRNPGRAAKRLQKLLEGK